MGPAPGMARDYGRAGQTFPVIEPDLLATIEARLRQAQASGALARMNATFAKRTEARVRRPDPVAGITPADRARSWDFDPTVTIERDLRDAKGILIAAAGQKINPLDFVTPRQQLVFVDGDDSEQMDWATSRYTESQAKIILVSGSPIDAMTKRQRRFYFDQQGRLTGRFGIRHTPAVVKTAGKVMRVSELHLAARKAG
ncbi:type-F conjugative transfer system protein TraW [Sphingobium baderi]|uniref:type-F conjugative transfer system protein TraW n=1 Tax=Sphingobium baderi TaxID=1332080 RepID=UPI002B413822|nr:type-F conjugative transfer system protein TraW [Sphingobium baderi]WRD78926.1 type-F conjugative transfer system protein TraW [Sphingobium baderi]